MHYDEFRKRAGDLKTAGGGARGMSKTFDSIVQEIVKREVEKATAEGELRGELKAERNSAIRFARNMMRDNVPLPKIAEYSGLSLGEVESLKNGLSL